MFLLIYYIKNDLPSCDVSESTSAICTGLLGASGVERRTWPGHAPMKQLLVGVVRNVIPVVGCDQQDVPLAIG